MNDVTSVPSVTSLSDAIEDKCVGEAAPSEYDETVKGVLPTQLEKIVPGVVNDEAAHLYSPVVKKRRLNEGEENELEQNQCAGALSSSSRASKLIGTGSNFPSGAASGLSTARSPATLMLPLSTIYPSDAALKNDAVAGKPSTSFPSLLGDIELCLGERSSSLDGSGLADAYHDFSSKNAGVSCKSLVSQFCKRAAGRALDVAQLTKQLRAPLRLRYRPKPSSSVAEDPDQPPRLSRLPTSRAARDLLTIKHPVLGRRMRLDIARLAALQEREQCVITLEHYCFRLLRALNFCFSSWGSHERSYVWHSNRICNALNYRDVSSYCLIFEDIIHEVHLCLNEVYGFAAAQQRRPHDSRPGRPRGATGKRGSGTASGFERMTSGEIPQVESAQSLGREENKNKNYSTAATKNAAVGQENTFAVAKHFKNTKSKRPATLTEIPSHVASGLLASLMFQLDVGMFGQCLTLLDTLRKQRDPNFQPFALTQEAIASFLTMQSFHAVHQPPLHFLNGAATRFRSAAELSSTAAGRGGRRRAAAAAAWTTFLELGGTVSSVGAPDILGLGKLRTKKQHSTETKTSLTALNRGVSTHHSRRLSHASSTEAVSPLKQDLLLPETTVDLQKNPASVCTESETTNASRLSVCRDS